MPIPTKIVAVRDFRITPLDSPIGVFLPTNRQDWVVIDISDKDLRDQRGTEVHRFRHWTMPNVYVRIEEPSKNRRRERDE